MTEYVHELRPRPSTHFVRLDAVASVLAAMDDEPFSSPEERAAKFEALLGLKGFQVVQAIPTFPERAIR